jgi:hypothetical protein
MLSMLRTAIESTTGKRPATGAAGLGRSDQDFDRVIVAIMNPLGGQAAYVQPDPNASLSKLIFDLAPPSHDPGLKTLRTVVNQK